MFRRLFERLPDIESVGEPDRLLSPSSTASSTSTALHPARPKLNSQRRLARRRPVTRR